MNHGPTPRPAILGAPPVSLPFQCQFPTALKIASTPFIHVILIRGSQIDATPYILPYTLLLENILGNPNSYLPFRSTHTRRIRSRTLQCSRLVARELGSCSSYKFSLGGSEKPCIFTSTSCKTYYQFIIFYLHGYAYFEYISC